MKHRFPSPQERLQPIVMAALLFTGIPAAFPADTEAPTALETRSAFRQLQEKYKAGNQYLPGYGLEETESQPGLPRVFAPTLPRTAYTKYPWKRNITTTIFWIGETPTSNNPTPNNKSSWDQKWQENFGGFDDPDRTNRAYFCPKAFVPNLNPFYVALPYNDIEGGVSHKNSAEKIIPWFKECFTSSRNTVLKGRWLAIRSGTKICYAQWQDVGPFETDDPDYVFGEKAPRTAENGGAGLDVSPAIRDFLNLRSGSKCDWRFVELEEVPTGPWREFGEDNPFVQLRRGQELARAETTTASVEGSPRSRDLGASILTPPSPN